MSTPAEHELRIAALAYATRARTQLMTSADPVTLELAARVLDCCDALLTESQSMEDSKRSRQLQPCPPCIGVLRADGEQTVCVYCCRIIGEAQ